MKRAIIKTADYSTAIPATHFEQLTTVDGNICMLIHNGDVLVGAVNMCDCVCCYISEEKKKDEI